MRAGGTLTLNNSDSLGHLQRRPAARAAAAGRPRARRRATTLYLQGGTAATVLTGTQTLAGADAVAGAGGLTKSGAGTLTLTGANGTTPAPPR